MSDDAGPRVPIVCDACDTTSRVPIDDLEATLAKHNERFHDGEAGAQVDPDIADQLADLVAEDMGLYDE